MFVVFVIRHTLKTVISCNINANTVVSALMFVMFVIRLTLDTVL